MSYMTVPEVASLLRVSELTVRRWIWAGKLPATRVGRLVRIKPADVESLSSGTGHRESAGHAAPRPGSPAALLDAARRAARLASREDVEELERWIDEGCERPGEIGSSIG